MKIFLIIVSGLIMLLAFGFVGESAWSALRMHQTIHSEYTPMGDYELLSELRLQAIMSTALFAILSIPSVGWFIMLVKSFRRSSKSTSVRH